jgi:hypothetical protein
LFSICKFLVNNLSLRFDSHLNLFFKFDLLLSVRLQLKTSLDDPLLSGELQALLGDGLNLLVLLMHALLELRMLLELDPLGLDQVSPQIHQLVP